MNENENVSSEQDENIAAIAAFCLSTCKQKGCQEAQVTATQTREKRLIVEANSFTLAHSLATRELTIALHKDGRMASVKTDRLDRESLVAIINGAIEIARFSLEDQYLNFATPALAPRAASLPFLNDPGMAALDFTGMRRTMEEMLAMVASHPEIMLDRMEMAVDTSTHSIMNSHGLFQEEQSSAVEWEYAAMAREGDCVAGIDYDGGFSLESRSYHTVALQELRRFLDRVLGNLHPKKCTSYKGLVILSPRAIDELLLDTWLYQMGGRQIMDGKSRWHDSLGAKVISDKITLTDDVHSPVLDGATAFDDDGIPTVPVTLIDQGVLIHHLHDCYTAKRMATRPNGLAGAPFCPHILGGDSPLADLVAARGELLLVDRFSGNSDPLTGDFSGVAKSSRLWRRGKKAVPVVETMIAGNSFELSQNIMGVSREVENVSGEILAPYLLVDGVTVSSAG